MSVEALEKTPIKIREEIKMAKAKVLIADKLSQDGIDLLKAEDGLQVDVRTGLSPAELAEIIVGGHTPMFVLAHRVKIAPCLG